MSKASSREVATRMYELFDHADVSRVDEVFAAGLVDHNPLPGAASSLDSTRALVGAVRDGFTNTSHEVVFQTEQEDGWVVTQWRMTATHTGEWFGTPASHRPVSFTGIDIVRVVDGRITEIRHVEELLQLQQQISA